MEPALEVFGAELGSRQGDQEVWTEAKVVDVPGLHIPTGGNVHAGHRGRRLGQILQDGDKAGADWGLRQENAQEEWLL